MTREIIQNKIQECKKKIDHYKAELNRLVEEDIMFSDEKQWFVEKEEEICVVKNKKMVKEKFLIGRIFWKEKFLDEDTQELIEIERNMIVRKNGKFIVGAE